MQIWKEKHTFKPPGGRIKLKLLASIVVIIKPWNQSVFRRSGVYDIGFVVAGNKLL